MLMDLITKFNSKLTGGCESSSVGSSKSKESSRENLHFVFDKLRKYDIDGEKKNRRYHFFLFEGVDVEENTYSRSLIRWKLTHEREHSSD